MSRKNTPVCVMSARASAKAAMHERILDTADRLFYRQGIRMIGVAELADPTHAAHRIAVSHKEKRRALFRNLLIRLGVDDPEALATQLMILGEGAVAQALVLGDPKMARAAREAARVLLMAAGVPMTASATPSRERSPRRTGAERASRRRI